MNLQEIYSYGNEKPAISFEVFPPKIDFAEKSQYLMNELTELKEYNPSLISVTYGAGGSTKSNSMELALKIKDTLNLEVMPHFTCVNADKKFVLDYISKIEADDIKNVLALRGDLPQDEECVFSDFEHAEDLVKFISSRTNLNIAVAGYPEGHPQSVSLDSDIDYLKKKVDEGASAIFTQLFFDNVYFYKYVDKIRKKGINIPVIPGILPITNVKQLNRMVEMCKVHVPNLLLEKLNSNQDNAAEIRQIGIEFASEQVMDLVNFGVKGMHFYILNKAEPVKTILNSVL
ncbi:MAG: methylenetetrahydrofolate reductase [NAD(P)H] [Candidatus Gastranaerophilales bacterium]|nr:methylenetetrahydrofolate reductase [NAD(P)H] [Candidatus Gastranaerophilales bacterium]